MDRAEIRERSRFLYHDELQYALARDEEVDTQVARERATLRLTREMEGHEIFELCRGLIDSIARKVERDCVVDFDSGQLGFGKALRVGDNTLCPVERARLRHWLAFDEIREQAFQRHAEKRTREREVIGEIIERLEASGDDRTTFEICPDLFARAGENAA